MSVGQVRQCLGLENDKAYSILVPMLRCQADPLDELLNIAVYDIYLILQKESMSYSGSLSYVLSP
jgi:hypothetical protein